MRARLKKKQRPPLFFCSPAEDGAVWSFNFFFYNRRAKRVVYVACRGLARGAGGGSDGRGKVGGASEDSDAYNSDSDGGGGGGGRRSVRGGSPLGRRGEEPYGLAGELDDLG